MGADPPLGGWYCGIAMEILHTAEFETPIGRLRVVSSSRGLAGWLRQQAPDAELAQDDAANREVRDQLLAYLEGGRHDFDLELDVRGTDFQCAVYDELLAIPYGETRSYADVARSVGRPKAVRATGTANGSNPIPLIVPCHRVVASNGGLGGYGGGLPLKRRLLAMERSRVRCGELI